MVKEVVRCRHCGSEQVKKNGFAPNGKQKYFCKDCSKASRKDPSAKGYPVELVASAYVVFADAKGTNGSEAKKEEILKVYQERSSLRGLTRTFGMSRATVTKWLKKSPKSATVE